MTDILELPELRERIARYSVEAYERMPEHGRRTELIRGIILEKMPKSPLHASIATLLFKQVLRQLPEGFTARQEQPQRFFDSMPEPDVAVIRGSDRDYFTAHPRTAALAIEVAVSSVALDRANAALYAENGVEEYWIIAVKSRTVEVYRRPMEGRYQEETLVSEDETLSCLSVPGIRMDLRSLFAPCS